MGDRWGWSGEKCARGISVWLPQQKFLSVSNKQTADSNFKSSQPNKQLTIAINLLTHSPTHCFNAFNFQPGGAQLTNIKL